MNDICANCGRPIVFDGGQWFSVIGIDYKNSKINMPVCPGHDRHVPSSPAVRIHDEENMTIRVVFSCQKCGWTNGRSGMRSNEKCLVCDNSSWKFQRISPGVAIVYGEEGVTLSLCRYCRTRIEQDVNGYWHRDQQYQATSYLCGRYAKPEHRPADGKVITFCERPAI